MLFTARSVHKGITIMGTENRPDKCIDKMKQRSALLYMYKMYEAPRSVRRAKEETLLALEAGRTCLGQESAKIVVTGAGTPGRIAAQVLAEMKPSHNWPSERSIVIMAGGERALRESVEGAEDNVVAAEVMADNRVKAGDLVLALSASGTTPFTLAVMRRAREKGAVTIGVANNPGTPLLLEAHFPVLLDTGPEPVVGLTQGVAGSAQRCFTSIYMTLLMTRLGFVESAFAINMVPSNTKLRARALKTVMTITGFGEDMVKATLEAAGWQMGLAIMMLVDGCSLQEANVYYNKLCSRNLAYARALMEADRSTAQR